MHTDTVQRGTKSTSSSAALRTLEIQEPCLLILLFFVPLGVKDQKHVQKLEELEIRLATTATATITTTTTTYIKRYDKHTSVSVSYSALV